MVLAGGAGWALQEFASVPQAILPAVLVGMVIASLVPVRGGCPLGRRGAPVPPSAGTDGQDG